MRDFLESYRYSSYQDYVGINTDRVENQILAKEHFPDYFNTTRSFRDFVESFFVEEETTS